MQNTDWANMGVSITVKFWVNEWRGLKLFKCNTLSVMLCYYRTYGSLTLQLYAVTCWFGLLHC